MAFTYADINKPQRTDQMTEHQRVWHAQKQSIIHRQRSGQNTITLPVPEWEKDKEQGGDA